MKTFWLVSNYHISQRCCLGRRFKPTTISEGAVCTKVRRSLCHQLIKVLKGQGCVKREQKKRKQTNQKTRWWHRGGKILLDLKTTINIFLCLWSTSKAFEFGMEFCFSQIHTWLCFKFEIILFQCQRRAYKTHVKWTVTAQNQALEMDQISKYYMATPLGFLWIRRKVMLHRRFQQEKQGPGGCSGSCVRERERERRRDRAG